MNIEAYWKAVGTAGLEHLKLSVAHDEIKADGIVLRHHQGVGVRLHYQVVCGNDWSPRRVLVQASDEQAVSLYFDGKIWTDGDGKVLTTLEGCETVDIMATPFTNTLAINQLKLSPGEGKDIQAVFITIPDLHIESSVQRYSHLDDCYLYENLDTGFNAKLWIDDDHLVKMYAGVWERLV